MGLINVFGTLDLGIVCLYLLKLALVSFGKLHVPPKLEVFTLKRHVSCDWGFLILFLCHWSDHLGLVRFLDVTITPWLLKCLNKKAQ